MDIKERENLFEVSFKENDFLELTEFPHPLQKVVMPVVARIGNKMVPLGTGFNIANYGLMLTARHVIDTGLKYAKKLEDKSLQIDASGEFELFAFYVSEIRHGPNNDHFAGGPLPVRRVSFSNHSDVALLSLSVPTVDGKLINLPALPLSPGIPEVGQSTIAFGYSKMKANGDIHRETRSVLNYSQKLNVTKGKIEDIHAYKRDNVMLDFPCFRTDARYDSGMSGGPIIGENGHVIGLISTSMKIEEENAYTSYGALLPHIFTLNTLIILKEDLGLQEYTLYDLAKAGHVPVDDTFCNIGIVYSNGKTQLTYR